MGQKYIPLKQLCPEIPNHVAQAIEKGMSLAIQDCFQSAREYMQALGFLSARTVPSSQSNASVTQKPSVTRLVYWLYGRSGVYAGKRKRIPAEKETTLGRLNVNDVIFPESTLGVSRYQCVLRVDKSGGLYVRDAGSSYGTFLNGQRIGKDWVLANPGSHIQFGMEIFELVSNVQ